MDTMKKQRTNPTDRSDLFDRLPDDLVIFILCKLTSTALSPSDFFTALVTCKRFNRLGLHRLVLNRAGAKTLAVQARKWCETAHRFLRRCVSVGNFEACYILGMIRFYCLDNQRGGLSLIAKAAIKSHTLALYTLGIIYFNGSGGATKSHKDLRAGVAFFARAASLGHVDALRELGHCLQDGYGVPRCASHGRRFLVQANVRELASSIRVSAVFSKNKPMPIRSSTSLLQSHQNHHILLLSELYGCHISVCDPHPANKFLLGWFASGNLEPGLRICSNANCGRPETRANEYRKCSVCGKANYCSRGCQAQDWKMRHKVECAVLVDHWGFGALDGGDDRVAEIGDLVAGPSG